MDSQESLSVRRSLRVAALTPSKYASSYPAAGEEGSLSSSMLTDDAHHENALLQRNQQSQARSQRAPSNTNSPSAGRRSRAVSQSRAASSSTSLLHNSITAPNYHSAAHVNAPAMHPIGTHSTILSSSSTSSLGQHDNSSADAIAPRNSNNYYHQGTTMLPPSSSPFSSSDPVNTTPSGPPRHFSGIASFARSLWNRTPLGRRGGSRTDTNNPAEYVNLVLPSKERHARNLPQSSINDISEESPLNGLVQRSAASQAQRRTSLVASRRGAKNTAALAAAMESTIAASRSPTKGRHRSSVEDDDEEEEVEEAALLSRADPMNVPTVRARRHKNFGNEMLKQTSPLDFSLAQQQQQQGRTPSQDDAGEYFSIFGFIWSIVILPFFLIYAICKFTFALAWQLGQTISWVLYIPKVILLAPFQWLSFGASGANSAAELASSRHSSQTTADHPAQSSPNGNNAKLAWSVLTITLVVFSAAVLFRLSFHLGPRSFGLRSSKVFDASPVAVMSGDHAKRIDQLSMMVEQLGRDVFLLKEEQQGNGAGAGKTGLGSAANSESDTIIKQHSEIIEELKQAIADASKLSSEGIDHSVSAVNEQVESLQKRLGTIEGHFETHRLDFVRLKKKVDDLPTFDHIVTLILELINEHVPKMSVGRVLSDGSISITPQFYQFLAERFELASTSEKSGGQDGNAADGSSKQPRPASSHFNAINEQTIKDFLEGRLSQVENRILSKDEIAKIIKNDLVQTLQQQKVATRAEMESITADLNLEVNQLKENAKKDFTKDPRLHSVIQSLMRETASTLSGSTSAAKVEKVNFALASIGARIVLPMTSQTYRSPAGTLANFFAFGVFGKPPMTTLLTDVVSPGDCWSFASSSGKLTVALADSIIPTDFTIEHVARGLIPDSTSAPYLMEIWALPNGRNESGAIHMATFSYKLDGPAVQSFHAQFIPSAPFRFIQLRILSNHGNPSFTCLYRFRVHSALL